MLSFAANLRIFLHAQPTDMRKSFDGLCGLVRSVLQADPLDGSLFLFVNRRGDRLKMLWWDRDGLALFYKRLESGTFEVLRPDGDTAAVELDATDWQCFSAASPSIPSSVASATPEPADSRLASRPLSSLMQGASRGGRSARAPCSLLSISPQQPLRYGPDSLYLRA